ncbi:class I SAM-dependent methyltransferase [Plantactinospora sp. WMMC1484]|uniref:class I SAM-dependent methyltransferase n=1 Tax=Plantactinospora sp. WMMC1484 TaxID=3404122 RepID=UPI003BF4F82E
MRAWHVHGLGGGNVLELGAGSGGTAAATADLGHDVLALELSPARLALARGHCRTARPGRLVVLAADFHDFAPERLFNVVTYWSGFGLGPDELQLLLLSRIAQWLADDGLLLVDVFDPAWWRLRSGQVREQPGPGDRTGPKEKIGPGHRIGHGQRIGFDERNRRLTDERWRLDRPDRPVREEIRCYDKPEFETLARCAGLTVRDWRPSLGSPDPPSNLATLGRC